MSEFAVIAHKIYMKPEHSARFQMPPGSELHLTVKLKERNKKNMFTPSHTCMVTPSAKLEL